MSLAPGLSQRPVLRGQEIEATRAALASIDGLLLRSSEVWLSVKASAHFLPFLVALGALVRP